MSRLYEDFDLPEDFRKKLHDSTYNVDDKKKLEEYKDKVFLYSELECGKKLNEGDLNGRLGTIIYEYFKSGDSPNNCAMRLFRKAW